MFVQKHASEFPNLKINYVKGADPVLKLKGPNAEDTVSLTSWTTDNLIQYLKEKLKP